MAFVCAKVQRGILRECKVFCDFKQTSLSQQAGCCKRMEVAVADKCNGGANLCTSVRYLRYTDNGLGRMGDRRKHKRHHLKLTVIATRMPHNPVFPRRWFTASQYLRYHCFIMKVSVSSSTSQTIRSLITLSITPTTLDPAKKLLPLPACAPSGRDEGLLILDTFLPHSPPPRQRHQH